MTKREATGLVRTLVREGWLRPEIIKYEHSWRVYATDRISGGRKHWDRLPE